MIAVPWHEVANARRPAFYADVAGKRLYVEQTVRSHRAHGVVGSEYQVSVNGVRRGEFDSRAAAQRAAVLAAQTWRKLKRPHGASRRGVIESGTNFDY